MTVAELVVKIGADVSDLKRGLLEAQAMLMAMNDQANRGQNRGFFGGLVQSAKDAWKWLNQMNSTWLNWIGGMTSGLPVIGQWTSQMGMLAPLFSGVEIGAVALVAIFAALVVVLTVVIAVVVMVADVIGTLAALLIDLAGPLSVVIAAFAMLGGGLMLGVTTALNNNWKGFDRLHDIVAKVGSVISALGFQLARDFLPYIIQAAQWALKFADYALKLAKLDNLSAALKSFSTTGIAMLKQVNDWLYKIVSMPVKLIFGIAFGGSGSTGDKITSGFAAMLKPWEHLGGQVAGIIEGWFDHLNLTKQGTKLGHELLGALVHGVDWASFATYLEAIIKDGFKTGFRVALALSIDLVKAAWAEIVNLSQDAWTMIENAAKATWDKIRSLLIAVVGPAAWSTIAQDARLTWSIIENLGRIAWDIIKIAVALVVVVIRSMVGAVQAVVGWINTAVNKTIGWHTIIDALRGGVRLVADVLGSVLGVVNKIIGAVQTVVSWVQKIASAASSIHFPSLPSIPGGGAASSLYHSIFGATGGIVTRPTFATIGEAGPEAVIPLSRAPGASALPAFGGGNMTVIQLGPTYGSNPAQVARELARFIQPYLGSTPMIQGG